MSQRSSSPADPALPNPCNKVAEGVAPPRPPRPFATLLPGDMDKGALPAGWYKYRLGLVDAYGKPTPGPANEEARQALASYMADVVDSRGKHRRWVALWTRNDDEGGWGWRAPRRTEYPNLPKGVRSRKVKPQVFGQQLRRRHVLGMIWRSRVLALLGCTPEGLLQESVTSRRRERPFLDPMAVLAIRLHERLVKSDHEDPLLALVLGPDWFRMGMAERLANIDSAELEMPPGDRWFRVATGVDHVAVVVVDLDAKEAEDVPHLRERVRLFTESPFMPSPHLITTSKGGGRHLWWFMKERAGACRGKDGQALGAKDGSVALVHALKEHFGAYVGPRVIEVFPASSTPGAIMPPLPFGPGSALCGLDGWTIEATDPLECIKVLNRRFSNGRFHRITIAELAGARSDGLPTSVLKAVAQPCPSVKYWIQRDRDKRAASGLPTGDDEPEGPEEPDDDRAGSRAWRDNHGRRGMTIAEAQEVWDEGPQNGQTNRQVPTIARLIKFHHGRLPREVPTTEDKADFLGWLGARANHRKSWWLKKLKSAFRFWQWPLRRGDDDDEIVTPTTGDVVWAARQIIEHAGGITWTRRRQYLVLMLYLLGRARSDGDTAGGWAGPIVVSSEVIQDNWVRWLPRRKQKDAGSPLPKDIDDEAEEVPSPQAWMIAHELMSIAFKAIAPSTGVAGRRTGRTASYYVRVPPEVGERRTITDAASALEFAVASLSDIDGVRLVGSRRTWNRNKL